MNLTDNYWNETNASYNQSWIIQMGISATTSDLNYFDLIISSTSPSSLSSSLSAFPSSTSASPSSLSPSTSSSSSSSSSSSAGHYQIPLYTIIFLLAVIGNSLVILTLVQNKRMRTITNLFLLNLSVSDLFLGVFCMPFTLIGTLLRDFVFGEIMCKFLPYLQATSIAVSSWTLVGISVERYYAICHPLRSRRWQTLSHAYKLIGIIWISCLIFMLPIAILSTLIPTSQGHHKCREVWPKNSKEYERAFNIFLDIILLVLPLLILGATYSMITKTLWQGIQNERDSKPTSTIALAKTLSIRQGSNRDPGSMDVYGNPNGTPRSRSSTTTRSTVSSTMAGGGVGGGSIMTKPSRYQSYRERERDFAWHQVNNWSQDSTRSNHRTESVKKYNPGLRTSNAEKSLLNKKRVIKMLFVVVLEFFICWTPLYIINTIALFNASIIYHNLGYTAISFFQLLAYSSSCCNPITYCFMNCGFRKSFLNLFRCLKLINKSNNNPNERRMSVGGGGGGGVNGGGNSVGAGVGLSTCEAIGIKGHNLRVARATNVTGNLVTSILCNELTLHKESAQQNSKFLHDSFCDYDLNDTNETDVINYNKEDIVSFSGSATNNR